MQAMCVLESGAVDAYGLTEEELAVICSSHSGESFHVNAIRSILSKAGLGEEYLQCGVHAPLNEQAAKALEQSGQAPGQIHNNCSGKHTGMLITAKHLGESLEDYYQPYHKVQRQIIEMIAYICQYDRREDRHRRGMDAACRCMRYRCIMPPGARLGWPARKRWEIEAATQLGLFPP